MAKASSDPDLRAADTAEIGRLDRAGHAGARRIVATAARYAAMGLVNLVACYAPDVIVLGGGVMGAYGAHLEEIRRVVDESAVYLPPSHTRIVEAMLDDHAGVIGAAYAAMGAPGHTS
jgi:glucokinase